MSRLSGWANHLGVTIFGPSDPSIAERKAKTARVVELQKTITRAMACERLKEAPGWSEYCKRVKALRDADVDLLLRADAKELEGLKSSIAAYTNVLRMMDEEVDEAVKARQELDQMIEDEVN